MVYANNHNYYPKSVVDMVDVMRQLKIKTSKKKLSHLDREKSDGNKNSDVKVTSEKSFVQRRHIICNVCGKPDELVSNYPLNQEIPMKNWFIKTRKVLYNDNLCQDTSYLEEETQEEENNERERSHTPVGWSMHQSAYI